MCDYSLEHYQSRPAHRGEKYITNRFPSGSIGFIVEGDQSVAVCMQCDARLRLEGLPSLMQTRLGIGAEEWATFARVEGGLYRDGIRFDNGRVALLQELGTGVTAWLHEEEAKPLGRTLGKAKALEEIGV